MTTRARLTIVVLAAAASLTLPASAPAAIIMSVTPTVVTTDLGREFTVRSTIRNDDLSAATGLIAHLTVLSLKDGTYVDPEDWSPDRTRYLDPLAGGRATTILWRLKAVTGGTFAANVSVFAGGASVSAPVTAPPVRIAVAERATLNAGGILPLSIGFPAALALVAVGLRLRRRQPRPRPDIA